MPTIGLGFKVSSEKGKEEKSTLDVEFEIRIFWIYYENRYTVTEKIVNAPTHGPLAGHPASN